MATWQFDLYIVPRGFTGTLDTIDGAWTDAQPNATWRPALDSLLPTFSSWHTDLEVWGSDVGHRVDVWTEEGRLRSILVRIDARQQAHDLAAYCRQLVAFVRTCGDAVLWSPSGFAVPPDATQLSNALQGSAAWRFVDDPDAFFRRIAIGGPEDG